MIVGTGDRFLKELRVLPNNSSFLHLFAAMRRVSRPRTAAPSKQEPPPIDTILKYPIEVWASAGDKFVKPEKVAADQKEMKNYRSMVSDITFELQKEKHKLRQLQGKSD